MRIAIFSILAFSLVVGLCPGINVALGGDIAPAHHPWGNFKPGAWKLVRVITETLDDQGKVSGTSKTEKKTTLMNVEDDGVTLEINVCVEVGGKIFRRDPQTVKQGLHGERVGEDVKFKEAGTGQVTVEGRNVPCKIMQLDSSDSNGKTVTKLYYCTTEPPYILKRESATTDPEGKTTLSERSVEVVARDMPYRVLAEIIPTTIVKTVHKHPKGVIITWSRTAADVPGGVVSQSTKEIDKQGRLIRRSTLELIEYSLEPEAGRTGLFGRKRSAARARKVSPRHGPR